MNINYYYHILDIGIQYEKGGKEGKFWKFNERKRLMEEVLFWKNLLLFISDEKKGVECSEQVFDRLQKLCKKYKFLNYERILSKKAELLESKSFYELEEEQEIKFFQLINELILEMEENINIHKNKKKVYDILNILHNLPKAMHGRDVLDEGCRLISCDDALLYASWNMDEQMRQKYRQYFD